MSLKKLFQFCFCVGVGVVGYSQNNAVYQVSTLLPGSNNTLIGVGAGLGLNGTGKSNNTFVGYNAGLNTTVEENTFIGTSAGVFNASGKGNAYMGFEAGSNNTSGKNNLFLGYKTGGQTVGGISNIAFGCQAGFGFTGSYNIAIGHETSTSANGNSNISIGLSSGRTINGSNNVLVGESSGSKIAGSHNVMIGSSSGTNMATGDSNIFMGLASAFAMNSGVDNIIFGSRAAEDLTSSNSNILIGNRCGRGLTTGTANTFLGAVRVTNPTLSNTIILADGSGSHRLHIDNGGNVGIGFGNDFAPEARLDVNGAPRFRGLVTSVDNTFFLSVDNLGNVRRQTIGAAAANIYNSNGTLNGERTVSMNNNRLIFDTDTNGRIYIGNTVADPTPFNTSNFPEVIAGINNNYKLLVEGGILTEKAKVALRSTANWADYVFANDYKLMPLQEIETFVKENKHLPGIESAEELVKGGLDLGEMQAKQMGKIEELTLYVIEQEKKLEHQNALLVKQNSEIEALKVQMKALMNKK